MKKYEISFDQDKNIIYKDHKIFTYSLECERVPVYAIHDIETDDLIFGFIESLETAFEKIDEHHQAMSLQKAYNLFARKLKNEFGASEYKTLNGYIVVYESSDKSVKVSCTDDTISDEVDNPFKVKIVQGNKLEYHDLPMNQEYLNSYIGKLRKIINKE